MTDLADPRPRLSERLALCFAAYQGGHPSTAFELFVATMEEHARGGEHAGTVDATTVQPAVAQALAAALGEPEEREHSERALVHTSRPLPRRPAPGDGDYSFAAVADPSPTILDVLAELHR